MQKPYAYSCQAPHLPVAVLMSSTVTQHDKTWEQPKASQLNNYQQAIQPAAQSALTQTPLNGNMWTERTQAFLSTSWPWLQQFGSLLKSHGPNSKMARKEISLHPYHFPLLGDPIYIL